MSLVLDFGMDLDKFCDLAFTAVSERCFVENWRDLIGANVGLNKSSLDEWLSNRKSDILDTLTNDEIADFAFSDYMQRLKMMVKRDAKVKLDTSYISKYSAAQNIVFHKKIINMIFAPLFKDIERRLVAILRPNLIMYTEMNLITFSRRLSTLLGGVDGYYKGEIDFSKFDKSQGRYLKTFEIFLYKLLGFDPDLLDLWAASEERVRVQSQVDTFSAHVNTQRRTGTSTTFLGNSIVTLTLLAMYYDLRLCKCVCFAGDDSIMFSDFPISDKSEPMVAELGMEAKFVKDRHAYFCSKFIIFAHNLTFVVPDPVKLVVKLGVPLVNISLIDLYERYVSFRDHTLFLGDEVICDRLALAVMDRYNCFDPVVFAGVKSIYVHSSNFKQYLDLYRYFWFSYSPKNLRGLYARVFRFYYRFFKRQPAVQVDYKTFEYEFLAHKRRLEPSKADALDDVSSTVAASDWA